VGDFVDIRSVDLQILGQMTLKKNLAETVRGFISKERAVAAYGSILDSRGGAALDQGFIQIHRDRRNQVVLDFRLRNEQSDMTIKGQKVLGNQMIRQFF